MADQGGQDDKPVFHVAPAKGWVNDPNGPFMYEGKYHLFYQHLPEGCEWAFGLVWGHSVSADLIHWEHLPHALVPTAASLDADGCFSGCATIDTDGTPVLLYTGVRLRTNPDAQPPPPPECDLHLPFIESQLYATPALADGEDPLLVHWRKEAAPFIGLPPPNMNLTGWRDPFVVERPCDANNHEWVVLMGSGIKEVGGATIVYRTQQLRDAASWRYDGLLCAGEGDTGAVWECPLLVQLNPLPAAGVPIGSANHSRLALGSRRSMSQLGAALGSPSAAAAAAAAADGGEHWQQQQQQQQHGGADGLGSSGGGDGSNSGADQLQAPASAQGLLSSAGSGSLRQQQQQQQGGPLGLVNPTGKFPGFASACGGQLGSWDERFTHFYSISPDACTNPTLYWLGRYACGRFDLDNAKGPLRLDLGDVLYAPNVMRDDAGRVLLWGWLQERRSVGAYDYAGCMSVPRLLHLDCDRLHQSPVPELLALRRGEAWSCSHVALGPEASLPLPGVVGPHCLDIEAVFVQGSASTVGVFLRSWHQGGEGGAAVLFNWESCLLEVVFEALDPATMAFSLTAPLARRIGGPVTHRPGAPLALRLLLDGSCLEIFTGSGEVLSTRVYRGSPPAGQPDAGIEFVALDGQATLERLAAYEMDTIWLPAEREKAAAGAGAAAGAAAAAGLEGLSLEEMVAAEQQAAAAADKAASLGSSLSSRSLSLNLSLSSSLRESAAAGSLSGKLQQLLLSPRASTAGGGGAGGSAAAAGPVVTPFGAVAERCLDPYQDLPPEEEMTADIFNLDDLGGF